MVTPSKELTETQKKILAHLLALGKHINHLMVECDWDELMEYRARHIVKHMNASRKLVRRLDG